MLFFEADFFFQTFKKPNKNDTHDEDQVITWNLVNFKPAFPLKNHNFSSSFFVNQNGVSIVIFHLQCRSKWHRENFTISILLKRKHSVKVNTLTLELFNVQTLCQLLLAKFSKNKFLSFKDLFLPFFHQLFHFFDKWQHTIPPRLGYGF